jgi:hypothetical protein
LQNYEKESPQGLSFVFEKMGWLRDVRCDPLPVENMADLPLVFAVCVVNPKSVWYYFQYDRPEAFEKPV